MAARCARLASREIDALVMSLFLPVMLMLTFVYLFGGAISTGTRYITYVVPGVLLLCAGVGSATTAVTVCREMTGIIDRLPRLDGAASPSWTGTWPRAWPATPPPRAGAAVGLGNGFRPTQAWPPGPSWPGCAALRGGAAGRASSIGRAGPTERNVSALVEMVNACTGFVPVRTMPVWLRRFRQPPAGHARHRNPPGPAVRHAHRRVRMAGHGVVSGILIASVALSAAAFRRRTR